MTTRTKLKADSHVHRCALTRCLEMLSHLGDIDDCAMTEYRCQYHPLREADPEKQCPWCDGTGSFARSLKYNALGTVPMKDAVDYVTCTQCAGTGAKKVTEDA